MSKEKVENFIHISQPFLPNNPKPIQMEMNKRNEHRSEREIINIYCTRVSFSMKIKMEMEKGKFSCEIFKCVENFKNSSEISKGSFFFRKILIEQY